MTSWNGLLRKEWVLLRTMFIGFIVVFIAIAVSSFAPIAVGGIFDVNEIVGMLSTMLIFFGMFLFLQSLHTDMKQPDLWFHSPASIMQLLGAKVFMTLLLVFGSILIWSGIGVIAYFVGGIIGIIPGWATLLKVFGNVIVLISVSLFIWVIYKLVEIRIGWLAGVVSVIPIAIASMLYGLLIAIWEIRGPIVGVFPYIIVSIVLFASGAILLDKKVRY